MITDAVLTYALLSRIVKPFTSWRAYSLGIIDEKGNLLKKRRDLVTSEERAAMGTFDLVALNLKKILAKVPGGSTTLGAAVAASLLMKEGHEEEFAEAAASLMEDSPTNSAGGGDVAGLGVGPQGEPGAVSSKNIAKRLARARRKRVWTKPSDE